MARDLMVQETIIADLRKRGFDLFSLMEPDLLQNDPSRKQDVYVLGQRVIEPRSVPNVPGERLGQCDIRCNAFASRLL